MSDDGESGGSAGLCTGMQTVIGQEPLGGGGGGGRLVDETDAEAGV